MQMQYGNLEETNSLHDNLFYNPFQSIALDVGLGAGAAGISRVGMARWGKKAKTQAELTANLHKQAKGASGFTRVNTFARKGESLNLTRQYRERHQTYKKASTNMRRLGRAFGLIGVGQIAFEGTKAIVGLGEAFATSRNEIESQRYQRMYDQETYYDTRAAFTQRQRALQVIHNSRLSMRPALGNESMYLHY